MNVPFYDHAKIYRRRQAEIDAAIHRVLASGRPDSRAVACRDADEFLLSLDDGWLRRGDVVLAKGSRAAGMERLVEALQAREAACTA